MYRMRTAILGGLALMAICGCSAEQQVVVPADLTESAAGEVSETAAGDGAAPAAQEVPASRAFVDPLTGELRAPTAAELESLQSAEPAKPAVKQQSAPAQAPATVLPDGTIMYDLRNQPQVEEKACVQADGSIGECPARQRAAP